jgi:hypothetical protein
MLDPEGTVLLIAAPSIFCRLDTKKRMRLELVGRRTTAVGSKPSTKRERRTNMRLMSPSGIGCIDAGRANVVVTCQASNVATIELSVTSETCPGRKTNHWFVSSGDFRNMSRAQNESLICLVGYQNK